MKIKSILIWSAIIIALIGALAYKILTSDETADKQPRSGSTTPLKVRAVVVKPEQFDNKLKVIGSLVANETVEIRSEISGKVTSINFKEGSNIAAGALLVKINDSELQAQLKKAQTRRSLAVEQEKRQRQLLESNGTSQENYDKALNELESADADIELLKAQIEKTEIRAPFAGTIGFRSISLGSYVSPNQLIANIYSLSPIKLDFNVPQKYFAYIKPGQVVSFRLPNSDKVDKAEIIAIEPDIDLSTRTLKVRALYPNKGREYISGVFVECELEVNFEKDSYLIPSEALTADIFSSKVYIYQNGKAVEKQVETGERTENQVQIRSGLTTGDTLITSGIIQLKQGLPVTVEITEKSEN
jgi:membrane fusion protein (multidrug efflux system)